MKKIQVDSLLQSGIVKDPLDNRDYIFTAPFLKNNEVLSSFDSLPSSVDHSSKMSKVKFQSTLGSCVAFSVCAMKEWQEVIEHEKEVLEGKKDTRQGKEYNLSEQWVYWNCKKIDPWPGAEGTNLRSAMKVLHRIGVPTEEGWPYSDDPINIGEPKSWAEMVAKWYLIGSYWRINGLQDIKKALLEGPIVTGMSCFEEMFGKLENGVIPYPSHPDEEWAAHAVCIVGYDDSTQMVKLKNSWSIFWAKAGYGYIPYKYVEDFVWDSWIARDISVTTEMLKEQRSLFDQDQKETVIQISVDPLFSPGTEKEFIMVGCKADNPIKEIEIVTKLFGVPESEIFKAAQKVDFTLNVPDSLSLFCKKYFGEMRREGQRRFGVKLDALLSGDDFCEDGNSIVGINIIEKDINSDKDKIEFEIEEVVEKVKKIKGQMGIDSEIEIYQGNRRY